MHKGTLAAPVLVLALAACTSDPHADLGEPMLEVVHWTPEAAPEAPLRPATPAAPPPGTLAVRRGDEVLHVPYVEDEDGMAVVGGDWVIGPVDELTDETRRGHALRDVWFPDGRIDWFSTTMTNSMGVVDAQSLTAHRTVTSYFSAHTPLVFRESLTLAAANLELNRLSIPPWFTSGGRAYGYWTENRPNPRINFGMTGIDDFSSSRSQGTLAHELMHALGFPHEFQRNDRNAHITMCGTVDPWSLGRIDRTVFFVGNPVSELSPYDHDSRTNSGYTCHTDLHGDHGGTRTHDPLGDGSVTYRNLLSVHDINSIYRVYAEELDQNENTDRFAIAAASADFDDDGFDDVALLSIEEDRGDNLLTVAFFRGVATDPAEMALGDRRFMPWFTHTVTRSLPSLSVDGSLAAGDFNGDGVADLAVGMPFEGGDVGEVRVLFVNTWKSGSNGDQNRTRDGRAPWGSRLVERTVRLRPADVGLPATPGTRFGHALAGGRMTLDGAADDLAIGAPGAANEGRVALVHGATEPTVAMWTFSSLLVAGPDGPGGEFGFSVAMVPDRCEITDFDPRAATLAVGAPGAEASSGAAHVFGCAGDLNGLILPTRVGGRGHFQPGARLGHAIAAARAIVPAVSPSRQHFLAIGAPFWSTSGRVTGRVYLESIGVSGALSSISSGALATGPGGDRLGTAIAFQQVADTLDLKLGIGAPGSNGGMGLLVVWTPFTAGGGTSSTAVSVGLPGGRETGAAVAPLHFERGTGGFVVGSPDGSVGGQTSGLAGLVQNASPSGFAFIPGPTVVHQETTGDRRPGNL